MWKVYFKKKVKNKLAKLPIAVQKKLANLAEDLEAKGPIRGEWQSFSSLGENKYHCHLSYSWVACWQVEDDIMEIEVYYAGSREKAPY